MSPLVPLWGEIDMCAHWLLCMKFNSQEFLLEQFFDIIGNFGSIQQENESTFSFQYNILFETYQYSEPPSSTPGQDKHVRPLTYLYKI